MKRWLSRLLNTVLVLVTLCSMFIVVAPRFFYLKVAVVLSGSMVPAMPTGSLAFTLAANPEDIRVGDIIAFSFGKGENTSTSHRVIEIVNNKEGLFFQTKGDANAEIDPELVPASAVQGRVIYSVPGVGRLLLRVMDYIRSPGGFVIMVVVPSLFIFGSTFLGFRRPRTARQKRLAFIARRRREMGMH